MSELARRTAHFVCLTLLTMCCATRVSAQVDYATVVPGYQIRLPFDEGSHPEFRAEWWYLTGWLEDEGGETFGFQVTFFRHRPGTNEDNPSRFAAKQLLFAHASLSDPRQGRLLRDEKIARAGFGLAEAQQGALDVHIDDWFLRREHGRIRTVIATSEFAFTLAFTESSPPLLQGEQGFSQKGPATTSASYYYSFPQLTTSGSVVVGGKTYSVRGVAWLDHEWFSSLMDSQARGWDWIGLNLDDGGAIMALQLRGADGAKFWAASTVREPGGHTRTFTANEVEWQAMRRWRSPRTGIEYPVEWRVRVGERTLRLRPLMDDQENDARGSTGTIYWEGAVRAYDAENRYVGKGYLELTGYKDRIDF